MNKARCGTRLGQKAASRPHVVLAPKRKLHRNPSRQMGILGRIDFPHAAGAKLFQDAVMGHACPDHGLLPLRYVVCVSQKDFAMMTSNDPVPTNQPRPASKSHVV